MTTLAPATTPAIKPIALDVATTLAGALTLWACGKGIAALGEALSLPNACWQLLALRAGAAALVVGGLAGSGRDRLWLFGLAYAALMSISHFSPWIVAGCVLAGVGASLLRHLRFGPVVAGLTFVVLLAAPGLYSRSARLPVSDLALDLAIRVTAAAVVLVGLFQIVRLFRRRPV